MIKINQNIPEDKFYNVIEYNNGISIENNDNTIFITNEDLENLFNKLATIRWFKTVEG